MRYIKIEIKWAVIFSLMTLLWMWLEKLSGLHEKYIDYHLYVTNLFAIPAITVMVLALKDKKNKFYNNQMNYRQGLTTGIILSIIIALFSPLTQWVTSYVITPEYFPNIIKRSVELGYYKSTSDAESNFNYTNYAKQGASGALIMGIATTTVAMFFVKTKKKQNHNSSVEKI